MIINTSEKTQETEINKPFINNFSVFFFAKLVLEVLHRCWWYGEYEKYFI